MDMKFVKGMLVGGLVSAGMLMLYAENNNMGMNKKKMMKKGRQFAKKVGIL